ncbi:hypothetical protein BHM03_00025953, partial [Ensete ventricosum]
MKPSCNAIAGDLTKSAHGREGGSSSTEAMAKVFELHNGEGDLVFCAVILWLSLISIVIFSSVGGPSQQRSRDTRLVSLKHRLKLSSSQLLLSDDDVDIDSSDTNLK